MSGFEAPRSSAPNVPRTTARIRSQRSTCVVEIFRYQDPTITKLHDLNISTEQILGGAPAATQDNLDTKNYMLIRDDVVRCTINKNKDNKGTFSVNLKKGKQRSGDLNLPGNIDYVQSVHPGDWIMIYLKKSGDIQVTQVSAATSSSGLKFLGVVENVRMVETDDPSTGRPRAEYLITGREFGKVFDMSLFFNPIVNQQDAESILGAKFLKDSKNTVSVIGNSPDKVVKSLIDFYLGGSEKKVNSANEIWYIPSILARKFLPPSQIKPKGVSFIDILNKDRIGLHSYKNNVFQSAVSLPGAAVIKSLPASGEVWSILDSFKNSATNELYTELVLDSSGKLKPSLVLRQLPFSNKSDQETNVFFQNEGDDVTDSVADSKKTFFVDLPRTKITSSDVRHKNIGKSDHDRINYVIVVPKVDTDVYDIAYVAGSNVPSIQRYGLRVLQAQTAYVLGASSTNSGDGIKNYCKNCVNLLQDWFFTSHNLFNGSLVIDGRDEFMEVGSNLYLTDSNQLFHVEGYTHNYEITPSTGDTIYNTEVRVTRGQLLIGARSKFIGASQSPNDPVTVVTNFVPNARRKS